jgi:hypothetical protein
MYLAPHTIAVTITPPGHDGTATTRRKYACGQAIDFFSALDPKVSLESLCYVTHALSEFSKLPGTLTHPNHLRQLHAANFFDTSQDFAFSSQDGLLKPVGQSEWMDHVQNTYANTDVASFHRCAMCRVVRETMLKSPPALSAILKSLPKSFINSSVADSENPSGEVSTESDSSFSSDQGSDSSAVLFSDFGSSPQLCLGDDSMFPSRTAQA